MLRRKKSLPALSDGQREIMEIIWNRGELCVSEVWEILSKRRPIARNTVQTMMTRMFEKRWLKYRTIGRAFLYSAAISRKATMGQKVHELIETVFKGSAEELMTSLLDYRGLSKGEVGRIRAMLDDAEPSQQDRKKRKTSQ